VESTGPTTNTGPIAVTPQVVNVAASSPSKLMLSVLTAVAIVLAVVAPPALSGWLRRRRRQEPGKT
jgi:threonine/homoserine/homoserine lactone efflux protein